MSVTPQDAQWMARAISLARLGLYTCRKNPRVGAVITKQQQIVGEGWHYNSGHPHAEIVALEQAGRHARGGTCYVSLEPCNYHGKTPPCSEALIAAGIERLVYGHEDPNPLVSGAGVSRLREGGIQVDGPLLDLDARSLNPGFIKRMSTGLPWIRVKSAMSIDGRTAMADGDSFWITSPQSRADVHRLRAQSCALITSWKTVERDQSLMTVRLEEAGLAVPSESLQQPLRVLLDSGLRSNLEAPFFKQQAAALIVTAEPVDAAIRERFCNDVIDLISLPSKTQAEVDLMALMHYLGQRGINEVLVEAGARLSAAFVGLGLVDELLIYIAPKLMGSTARPLFDLPINVMDAALPLHIDSMTRIGRDIKLRLLPELE